VGDGRRRKVEKMGRCQWILNVYQHFCEARCGDGDRLRGFNIDVWAQMLLRVSGMLMLTMVLCFCCSEMDFVADKKVKPVPKIRKHSSFQTPQALLARLIFVDYLCG